METVQMGQTPEKELIDIGDLIQGAWELFLARIKVFLGIMGVQIVSIAALLLAFIGIPLALLAIKGALTAERFNKDPLIILPIIVPIAIAVILIIFVAILSRLALILAISDETVGQFTDYFKRAYSFFWSYAWITFLVGIIVGVGFILLIVPGVIFWIWFAFPEYILVKEGFRGMTALDRSKELVKGRFVDIFIRLLIITALAFAANAAVAFVLSIVPPLSGLSNLFSTLVVTPYVTIAYYLLYRSAVETREIREAEYSS